MQPLRITLKKKQNFILDIAIMADAYHSYYTRYGDSRLFSSETCMFSNIYETDKIEIIYLVAKSNINCHFYENIIRKVQNKMVFFSNTHVYRKSLPWPK